MAENMQAIIGLMAGTSVDGIDAALVWSDGRSIKRAGFASEVFAPKAFAKLFDYRPRTRAAIFKAFETPQNYPPQLPRWIAEDHLKAVQSLINESGVTPDLIGFHGQTILHAPSRGASLQLGDAQHLADQSRIPVVHQFRQADLEGGGQGAPLAPIYHKMLMDEIASSENAPSGSEKIMVNIGGVSNITLSQKDVLIGFDSGPGNALIDDAARRLTGQPIDRDGRRAARGTPDSAFLKAALDCSYFHQPGVKSLDRQGLYAMIDLKRLEALSAADQLASLTALTAATIDAGLKANLSPAPKPQHIIITGGGSLNPTLMAMIRQYTQSTVTRLDEHALNEHGLDSRFTEAELMAVLAARHHHGLPFTFPTTTGVKAPCCGGVTVLPSGMRFG